MYGIFAGGIPSNGPMVYSESFKEDLESAMGLASIGRALAALSLGPLASNFIQIRVAVNNCDFQILQGIEKMECIFHCG